MIACERAVTARVSLFGGELGQLRRADMTLWKVSWATLFLTSGLIGENIIMSLVALVLAAVVCSGVASPGGIDIALSGAVHFNNRYLSCGGRASAFCLLAQSFQFSSYLFFCWDRALTTWQRW